MTEPLPNSYVDGVKTVIEVGSMRFGVAESPDDATCEINAHRETRLVAKVSSRRVGRLLEASASSLAVEAEVQTEEKYRH